MDGETDLAAANLQPIGTTEYRIGDLASVPLPSDIVPRSIATIPSNGNGRRYVRNEFIICNAYIADNREETFEP